MNDAHKIEPVAPTVEMWRGRPAPAKPDLIGADPIEQWQKQENNRRIEQERELEEQHRSRAVKRLPEQPRVDLVSELDSALTTLEAGAVDFEKSHGQPNSELIEGRKLVAELTARLAEERAKLSEIEARGAGMPYRSQKHSCRDCLQQPRPKLSKRWLASTTAGTYRSVR
jgi:hypothetical protein